LGLFQLGLVYPEQVVVPLIGRPGFIDLAQATLFERGLHECRHIFALAQRTKHRAHGSTAWASISMRKSGLARPGTLSPVTVGGLGRLPHTAIQAPKAALRSMSCCMMMVVFTRFSTVAPAAASTFC